ncbi:MAG: hypothetical protein K0R17_3611 [Rariglobus sp.]|jgi:hypothetical protein|nr:hypothetical protein [Rariglobus sp.]
MLKYVRLYHPTEFEIFVFTGATLSHEKLAKAYAADGYTPISAGFVQFGPAGLFTTLGESVSLKLKPMPDDAQRIYLDYAHTVAPFVGTATTAHPAKSETVSDLPPINIASTPRPDWQKDPFYSASVNCRP